MTLIAVTGDCTTTTCVGLASAWPNGGDNVIVLEADPCGGSLAGWLDTPASPSLAAVVAAAARSAVGSTSTLETILTLTQQSRSGIRFIAAPTRTVPARRAIEEAGTVVLPALAGATHLVAIGDLGRPSAERSAASDLARVVFVVHRQESASAAAESVRLERLVEQVERVARGGAPVLIGIIGTNPFDPADIVHFVDAAVPGAVVDVVRLPEDPLTAAVLAGRTGVSAKRLQRLPLMRAAADAVDRIRLHLDGADQRSMTAVAEVRP